MITTIYMKKLSRTPRHNLSKILANPKYKGKHVVVVDNKIFSAVTGQEASRIFKQVVKNYPKKKPTITYIPKEDTLILVSFVYGNKISL